MSDAFDPYYSWLGIPPAQQPADYYRLLGINRFEGNQELIANAAERQIRHIETFKTGLHAKEAEKLLNKLATAKACLSDVGKKQVYDRAMSGSVAAENSPPVASDSPKAQSSKVAGPRTRNPLVEFAKIVLGGIAGLVIGMAILWYGFGMDVLGVMESRDEHAAEPIAQNDADAKPKPSLQAGRMETKNKDAVASPPSHAESPENDAPAPKSLPEAPLNDSGSQPDATVRPDAEPEMRDQQQAQADDLDNPASSEATPEYEDAAPVRGAVPPADSVAAAEAIVRSVFAEEYASAKTPAEKSDLAAKLLQVGLDTTDDIASRYVTLRSARNVAVEGGDVDLALRAFESISESFDVDVLAERVRLVVDLSKASLSDAEATKLRSRIVELRRWAFNEDRYPLANALNQTAKQLEKATDKEWQKSTAEWTSLLEAGASAFELVKEAIKTLEESPDDPEGNLIIGRYRCLLKGEWSDGLPYLEKGSDENLRAFAEQGSAAITTPIDTLALADSWWSFTIEGDLADFETRNIQSWAAYLYRRALPDLSGLSKVRVEKRLQDLESLGVVAYVHTPMNTGELLRVRPEVAATTTRDSQTTMASLTAGLVAYYPFNGNAKDESGNGNDGTIIGGGVTPTADRFGAPSRAFDFNGKGGHINIGHAATLALQTYTVSAWFKWRSNHPKHDYGAIIAKGNGGELTPMNYMLLVQDTDSPDERSRGTFQAIVGYGDTFPVGNRHAHLSSGVKVVDGKWHHALMTYDSVNSRFVAYLNGQLVALSESARPAFADASIDATIGIWGGPKYGPWDGQLDDVRIYNRALSAEIVKALYDFEKPKEHAPRDLPDNDFIGRWRILADTRELASVFTLLADHTAKKSHEPKVEGTWRVTGNEVRIEWSDGWRDILRVESNRVRKLAFAPGSIWDKDAPTNEQSAIKSN